MNKLKNINRLLERLGSVAVAFSGGVDSTLLAYAAKSALGDNAIAITIDSITLPRSELKNAKDIAEEIGIKHLIVKHDMDDENFLENPHDRCYYCKKSYLRILKELANKNNIEYVVDGTNADDLNAERYGLRALKEENVISPLAQAGLSKQEIRKLARELKLSNAEKPPMACLASRIPCGKRLTKERLKMVEKAEDTINQILNSNDVVRVRDHGEIARIECSNFLLIMKNKNKIIKKLKDQGFEYIVLDLVEYK